MYRFGAGLRRADSKDAWTWIAVPETWSRARTAGFAVANPEDILTAPFKSLRLLRQGDRLEIEESDFGLAGVYEKPAGSARKSK